MAEEVIPGATVPDPKEEALKIVGEASALIDKIGGVVDQGNSQAVFLAAHYIALSGIMVNCEDIEGTMTEAEKIMGDLIGVIKPKIKKLKFFPNSGAIALMLMARFLGGGSTLLAAGKETDIFWQDMEKEKSNEDDNNDRGNDKDPEPTPGT